MKTIEPEFVLKITYFVVKTEVWNSAKTKKHEKVRNGSFLQKDTEPRVTIAEESRALAFYSVFVLSKSEMKLIFF